MIKHVHNTIVHYMEGEEMRRRGGGEGRGISEGGEAEPYSEIKDIKTTEYSRLLLGVAGTNSN